MPAITETRPRENTSSAVPEIGRNNRAGMLDLLRGIAIVYVMLYHLIYDLIFFAGKDLPFFFTDLWEGVHQFFLIILFGVSGICAGFSKNVLRRGAVLFLMGEALTIFTAVFLPDNLIVFGVLSCFGSAMLIYGVISPLLKKLPNAVVFVIFCILSILFWNFSRHDSLFLIFTEIPLNLPRDIDYLYPIGITSAGFHSADYFPLIPYGFVFLAGTALSDFVRDGRMPNLFYTAKIPVISFLGRYSLWAYIIHQPIFMAITYFLF